MSTRNLKMLTGPMFDYKTENKFFAKLELSYMKVRSCQYLAEDDEVKKRRG